MLIQCAAASTRLVTQIQRTEEAKAASKRVGARCLGHTHTGTRTAWQSWIHRHTNDRRHTAQTGWSCPRTHKTTPRGIANKPTSPMIHTSRRGRQWPHSIPWRYKMSPRDTSSMQMIRLLVPMSPRSIASQRSTLWSWKTSQHDTTHMRTSLKTVQMFRQGMVSPKSTR